MISLGFPVLVPTYAADTSSPSMIWSKITCTVRTCSCAGSPDGLSFARTSPTASNNRSIGTCGTSSSQASPALSANQSRSPGSLSIFTRVPVSSFVSTVLTNCSGSATAMAFTSAGLSPFSIGSSCAVAFLGSLLQQVSGDRLDHVWPQRACQRVVELAGPLRLLDVPLVLPPRLVLVARPARRVGAAPRIDPRRLGLLLAAQQIGYRTLRVAVIEPLA